MKFFSTHKGLFIFLLAVLLALALTVSSFVLPGRVSPVSAAIGSVFKPVETLIFNISDGISSLFGYQREYEALSLEIEQLRIQIARMEEEARLSVAANEENARLRELLKLAQRRREFTWESAGIIARDTSNWARTLTLSRGTSHGIAVGDAVMSAEGFLVGIISEAGPGWSTVTTIIDTDMDAGAKVERTGQNFVAEGDFELMQQGLLKLSFLPTDTNLQNGDLVLTSGIGGLYPRDLPIGTVERLEVEFNGISSRAVLKPSVDLDSLTQVFVVLAYDITE